MEIDKLKSFLTLANAGSFTKAAEELYMSQPALSKQIQSLEHELKVPLVNRSKRTSSLTIYGEYFKPYAETIVNTYVNATEHIRQIENLEEGTLGFGATNFIGVYLVHDAIRSFRSAYPGITVNMKINSSKNLLHMLHNYQLEFILLSDYVEINEERFTRHLWKQDEIKVVVSANHPLSKKKRVTLDELRNEVFISKGDNSSLTKYLHGHLDMQHSSPLFPHQLHLSHQEAIKQAVIRNMGFSFLSPRAVALEEKAGLLKSLSLHKISLTRDICLVHEKNRHLTPAARAFLDLMKIEVGDM